MNEELLTVKEVAAKLRVSIQTVHGLIDDRALTAIVVGKGVKRLRRRIPASALAEFIKARTTRRA